MIKGFAVVALLCGLYGGHVLFSPLVYEDARLVEGGQRPFAWRELLTRRGLSTESWTIVQSPRASHALNLTLHLLVVALVGHVWWRLTQHAGTAWGVALITALHPVTVETVAYAASRSELIAAVGVLLVLLSVTGGAWGWLGVLPALWLALIGKESGMVSLGLIPLVLWYQGRVRLATITAWIVLGLAVACLPLLDQFANIGERGVYEIDAVTWLGMQSVATWRLVVLSAAPLWLSVSPELGGASGWAYASALVLLAGSLECAWRARVTAPLVTLGIVGCAIVAAPRFLVRTPGSPFNEHQWYLAVPFVACVLLSGLMMLAARVERVRWSTS